MTDKQIIIDGVDVSGCEYLDNIDFDELCLMLSSPHECQVNCSNKPNCYYKQLMRKGQECQQAMDNYVQLDLQRVKEYNELVDLYKAKEQECEELKDKLNCCFCNPYVELNDIEKRQKCVEVTECFRRQLDQLKIENKKLKESLKVWKYSDVQYIFKINKYEQTLTEIKEIAKGVRNYLDCPSPRDVRYEMDIILQKISEVGND